MDIAAFEALALPEMAVLPGVKLVVIDEIGEKLLSSWNPSAKTEVVRKNALRTWP